MNNIKNLAVMVDERLAELMQASSDCDRMIKQTQDRIRRAAGQKYDYRIEKWDGSFSDALSILIGKSPMNSLVNEYQTLLANYAQIVTEINELDDVFKAFRWTRAFLVLNSNGHIHSNMSCNTCFYTTQYEWLTAYSADDENDIVAAAGETACTVCYPSAPADILNQPSTIQSKNRAEKEAAAAQRATAKAVREAKRIASAPTASGASIVIPSTWRDGRNEEIKTERTAVSEWYRRQDSLAYNYEDRKEPLLEGQRIIEEALAGKRGVTVEEVRADLLKRYAKRK